MSYWDRLLAITYRLQADRLEQARTIGWDLPADAVDTLRQRADAIDPGQNEQRPSIDQAVSFRDWLRGIRSIDGSTITVKPRAQPSGAHDAVRIGEYRFHRQASWRSLIDYNTTEPGSDPRWWVQEDPALVSDGEDEEPVTATPWQPDMAVTAGQLLSHDGRIYRVVQDHTTAAHWVPGSPGLEALYVDEGPA